MNVFRVSHLASYHYHKQHDWGDLGKVVRSIKNLDEETEAMKRGTALHRAIELSKSGGRRKRKVNANGYTFIFEVDCDIDLSNVREWRQSKVYDLGSRQIEVSGQIDSLIGNRIDDHKTTSAFDALNYLDGYQWRFYLDIFGTDIFRWNAFVCKQKKTRKGIPVPNTYRVTEFHQLEQYRYPKLHDDCLSLVSEFAEFAEDVGLL